MLGVPLKPSANVPFGRDTTRITPLQVKFCGPPKIRPIFPHQGPITVPISKLYRLTAALRIAAHARNRERERIRSGEGRICVRANRQVRDIAPRTIWYSELKRRNSICEAR